MSAESIEWLNTYTLQSRRAWHTSEKIQQLLDKPTVYDGPIPVADVKDRLFNWEPLEAEVKATTTILTPAGVETVEITPSLNKDGVPNKKAICRPPRALGPNDPGDIFEVPMTSYNPHSYASWLIDNVAVILGDDLQIFSAGLLRAGAVAWVQVTVPDTITTPEGVEFRPNLLAATSLDKSLSTTYKRTIHNAVCDNTMAAALNEIGQDYRIKHSSGSDLKIAEARADLQIQFAQTIDTFSAEVASLCQRTVTDRDFDRFLESLASTRDENGLKTGAAATRAKNKQDEYRSLWQSDPRVSPWKNTAYGVVQAVNTYAHHVADVRGDRDEVNMRRAVFGEFNRLDVNTVKTLDLVLA